MSKIEWTGKTLNPIRARHRETGERGWACVRVSPGCVNCYAATQNQAKRFGGTGLDYTVPALEQVEHFLDERTLTKPLHWRKPQRVFMCSMTDIFGEWVPDEWLDRIFAVMALTPQHTYQVLTKRPERMREYLTNPVPLSVGTTDRADMVERTVDAVAGDYGWHAAPFMWPLPNVWLGVSAEDQERLNERYPLLADTPAAVHFLSLEPLLGSIVLHDASYPEWVIVGGESGPRARPFDLAWARSIIEQCRAASVPVFVKQLGPRPLERNDAGFDGEDFDEWPEGTRTEGWHDGMYQGENVRVRLRDRKGANPEEWPDGLRVREFPA